ncbi:MAG: sulfite exporter TauE/SafE family protein [Deltaproteobacteria bacterium]|nr:sulfite exporter TauE/SafE family protein [Candidatus Zymogenaceae bacterium]
MHHIIVLIKLISIYLAVGAVVGANAGFIGGGGGSITVPVLIYTFTLLGYPLNASVHTAVGTSLFLIFVSGLSGSLVHIAKKSIHFKIFAALASAGVVGAWVGGALSIHINGDVFKKLLAVMLLLLVYRIHRDEKENDPDGIDAGAGGFDVEADQPVSIYVLSIITGFLSGFLSGFFGIGGAIVMLPASMYLLKFSPLEAVAHSTCLMMVTAFIGFLTQVYYGLEAESLLPGSIGYFNYTAGIPMAISGIVVTRWAAARVHMIDHDKMRNVLLVVLVIVAFVMVVK